MEDQIKIVADNHEIDIGALNRADTEAEKELRDFGESLRTALDPTENPEIDVILGGSFARRELTRDSDCDFLVIVDQTIDHNKLTCFIREIELIREMKSLSEPGRQGIFGDFVTAAELLGRIGLDADSNTNTTRRLILLTESVSVYESSIRSSVIDRILDRYCSDYNPVNRPKDDHIRVPRFLSNDLIRFWRTMAVDFGAKRWRSLTADWYLRYAKLVTTRKVLFAGSLASLFLTDVVLSKTDPCGNNQYTRMKTHLKEQLDMRPLARLMSSYEYLDDKGKDSLANILGAYNQFIEILDTRDSRNLMKRINDENIRTQSLRNRIDQIVETIQTELEYIFFENTVFRDITKRYGLF